MTDEEVNKKFDVVAGHLATLAVGLQTLGEKVDGLAEGQRRTDSSVRALLAVAEIQAQEIKDLSESVKGLTGSVKTLDERQREADERGRRTDERLDALINIVERYISEKRNGEG
jgi:methyl-accepting chemotaxis protein